jgi:peroxiredoxin
MAALEAPAGAIGWQAKDFTLEDAYGNPFRLSDLKGPSGTLVMFICNQCPYVRDRRPHCAGRPRSAEARARRDCVMPNDYVRYPEDAPEQMKRFAKEHNLLLPLRRRRDT